ncbi:hypothetical protein HRbin02_00778 [Candidatus Calditenuaceae archaeon HR02]|nr:hypothetical protein HRbin02_00778 [Candidatus Calditenuaceae archaeon HR02]
MVLNFVREVRELAKRVGGIRLGVYARLTRDT